MYPKIDPSESVFRNIRNARSGHEAPRIELHTGFSIVLALAVFRSDS